MSVERKLVLCIGLICLGLSFLAECAALVLRLRIGRPIEPMNVFLPACSLGIAALLLWGTRRSPDRAKPYTWNQRVQILLLFAIGVMGVLAALFPLGW